MKGGQNHFLKLKQESTVKYSMNIICFFTMNIFFLLYRITYFEDLTLIFCNCNFVIWLKVDDLW